MSNPKGPQDSPEPALSAEVEAMRAENLRLVYDEQNERLKLAESAAMSNNWPEFKKIVRGDGGLFVSSQLAPGELQSRFGAALAALGKDWTHLLLWRHRFAYQREVAVVALSALLILVGTGAALLDFPGVGALFGLTALILLWQTIAARPEISEGWWVSAVTIKPPAIPSSWKSVGLILACLLLGWWVIADSKSVREICEEFTEIGYSSFDLCVDDIRYKQYDRERPRP